MMRRAWILNASLLLLILLVCSVWANEDSHGHEEDHEHATEDDDHGHDNEHGHGLAGDFEFKAIVVSSSDPIRAILIKPGGDDDDHDHDHDHEHEEDHPRLFLISVGDGADCGKEHLEEAEEELEELIEQVEHDELTPTEVEPGGVILAPGVVELHVSGAISTYSLLLAVNACTALFAKHSLSELGLHFVNETSGTALEFSYVVEPDEVVNAPSNVAGVAIAGAIVVCVIPFVLIIFCLPLTRLHEREHLHLLFHFLNAFGGGALIAVVALHLYPEMTLGLNENNEPMWKGGAMVIGGIMSVALIHVIADRVSGREHDPEMGLPHATQKTGASAANNAGAEKDLEKPKTEPVPSDGIADSAHASNGHPAASFHLGHSHAHHGHNHSHSHGHGHGHGEDVEAGNGVHSMDETSAASREFRIGTCRDLVNFKSIHPLIWSLTLGDALHNFVDGTIIATAFLVCGTTAGWITVGATIAHEVPQEIGDFAVMMSMGATVGQALFFNFLSQSLAILGCGIVLGIGNGLPENQTGLLLAFGVGTFLFIALTDIMPLVLEVKTATEYLSVALGFIIAFVAIGLSTMGASSCGHSH